MPAKTKESNLNIDKEQFKEIVGDLLKEIRGNRVVALGSSPVLFLETATLMEDGIKDYTFASFPGAWHQYLPDSDCYYKREEKVPSKEKQLEFKKYFCRKQLSPRQIVDHSGKTGEKTVIVDYLDTGKTMKSFLEFMDEWANESLGKADRETFFKSIKIVTLEEPMSSYSEIPAKIESRVVSLSGKSNIFSGLYKKDFKKGLGLPSPTSSWEKLPSCRTDEEMLKEPKKVVKEFYESCLKK